MNKKVFFIINCLVLSLLSCKKDTLVEVVDVPATPIMAVEKTETKPSDLKANEGAFQLYNLPFEYKALEPYVDSNTLELHYSKYLLPYVNALNKAVIGTKYEVLDLLNIFKNLNYSDADIRNYAGAVYNHNFYLESIAPKAGGQPSGELLDAINRDFGSFDQFIQNFSDTSVKINGSGWTWLLSDRYGKLKIITTANNDAPQMKGLGIKGVPLLCLDMWEHAYYLKFQNRKKEYANTFFSIVNWPKIEERYNAFSKLTYPTTSPVSTTTIEEEVDLVPSEDKKEKE
ncbi:superoxide dismutase [Flavobacterium oreochromis]|uniref:superoxide dismutase n=1 Tax=Flavobacterium columnare TaxID=996 RepID=A0A246GDM6_9FLAO|nr:superoxide dismutase [Flavobacterium oreochromis]OWP79418.1 superoxide dismutase [Flavobacterium oreochromis]POR27925.1 superoxide dismutase [Flavobacterium columnare]